MFLKFQLLFSLLLLTSNTLLLPNSIFNTIHEINNPLDEMCRFMFETDVLGYTFQFSPINISTISTVIDSAMACDLLSSVTQ